jgi:hypothetical protein
MDNFGVMYTCYKENRAVEFSIKTLKEVYPEIKIYLVSDGGTDFSYLKQYYQNIETILDKDTMGPTKPINPENYRLPENQIKIKNCAFTTINRLNQAINFCQKDYILMMDPDTLVRGKLNVKDNVKLLGTRLNTPFPEEYKKILAEIPSAKVINCWGATPGIFHVETYKKAIHFLYNNLHIFDKFTNSFYAMHAHDVLLPTLFALVGEEETYNPEIVECLRNPGWAQTNCPLVHQFRYYY